MHLIRLCDAPHSKKDCEWRRYYTPDRDPLEVIETVMKPNASQSAHSHSAVREAMLVLEGTVYVEEIVSDSHFGQTIGAGDFLVFDRGVLHRMKNRSDQEARTLHFKFVGNEKDRALFLNDKSSSETTSLSNTAIPALEARYSSYVETHSTLDKIIWQIPAFLVAVSVFAAGLIGAFIGKDDASLPPFTHNQTLGLFLCFWGVMYLLGCYAMERIRHHHSLAAKIIAPLDPKGYFDKRLDSIDAVWPVSATSVIKAAFTAFGIALLLWGAMIFRV